MGFDLLTRKNKGHKNSLAARLLALSFAGLCFARIAQPRQPVAAVDQLFNVQLHADRLHDATGLVETQHASSLPNITYRTGSSAAAHSGRAIVYGRTACATAPSGCRSSCRDKGPSRGQPPCARSVSPLPTARR